jgi:signal peptidase I
MGILTALLYGALLVYMGGWILDLWIGNFALVLALLTLVTFAYWLAEKFHFAPARRRSAEAAVAGVEARRAELARQGVARLDENAAETARAAASKQPWWLDWTAGLFPVIAAVFVLRSFVVEPFKIPSGSMLPTLQIGDLILVNKYHYGLRLPVVNTKLVENNAPARGDVVVFHYPPDPRIDYIKRIVGTPGDRVEWKDQKLSVNGQSVPVTPDGQFYNKDLMRYVPQYQEQLGERKHAMLVDDKRAQVPMRMREFVGPADACRHTSDGVSCQVPQGHYFVMGDNREDSLDSRFWGFVPQDNLVGRAFFVWMNFGNLGRIGSFQ